jgi:hypothetical protein
MIWDLASERNERIGQHRIDSHRWRLHVDVAASAQPLGRVIAFRRSANRLESPQKRVLVFGVGEGSSSIE